MTQLSRRSFLSATTTLCALAPAAGLLPFKSGAATNGPHMLLEPAVQDAEFDGTKCKIRCYNGKLPGPTLYAKGGDKLLIRLKNSLPPSDSAGWNHNHDVPHAFGATNLHFHGLDIAPELFVPLGTSNPTAPMIHIKPGETFDYPLEIPGDHPPGLYWYHPHHHGSTVLQAVSGMAGPIIIKGAIDEVPEIKAARDIPIVIQDIGLFPGDDDAKVWTYLPKQNAIWQTFGGDVTIYDPKTGKAVPTSPPQPNGFTTGDYHRRFYLMNGEAFFREDHNFDKPDAPVSCPTGKAQQQCPVPKQLKVQQIRMAPGEVVRFRVLNGCSDNFMPIMVEGHAVHLLAMDGRNFPEVRTIPVSASGEPAPQLQLAPANRAEFLIQASTAPGTYKVVQLAQNQQFLYSTQKTIFEIVVTKEPAKTMGLPTRLPLITRYYPLIKPDEIKRVRTIQFSAAFPAQQNPVVGVDFMINNMEYEESAVPVTVHLNDAEEWNLVVGDPSQGGNEGHPFHIHINGFEVISIGGVAQPPGLIQDTIWVPQATTVVVRMKFRQFTGKAVFHCHILPHEDTGMMQNFLILGPEGAEPHH